MKKEIHTKININAPIDKVWNILSNTENYEKWNPFMVIEGNFEKGETIKLKIKLSPKKVFKFKPVITVFEKGHIEWKGKFLFPGLLDACHTLRLNEDGKNKTTFIHEETFSGLLTGFLDEKLTESGFEKMNQALKKQAEK